jgi:rhodanese-related sulfurtransferase
MTKSANFWAILLATALLAVAHPVMPSFAQTDVAIKVLKAGVGEEAVRHSRVEVHYTGWLQDGTKFDSSNDRGQPLEFTIGAGQVIPGWDLGIEGMRSGGKRELTIPPQLAYGRNGAGSTIPPNATLKFEVELVSVKPPKYSNIDNVQLKTLLERGVKILDIRRADEWKQTGVVQGSKLITAFDGNGRFVSSFRDQLRAFAEPDEELILICRTGNRSSVIANALAEQAGYSKVYNVTDGIVKWIKDGNPVVR